MGCLGERTGGREGEGGSNPELARGRLQVQFLINIKNGLKKDVINLTRLYVYLTFTILIKTIDRKMGNKFISPRQRKDLLSLSSRAQAQRGDPK